MKYTIEELEQDLLHKNIAIYPSLKFHMGRYGEVTAILPNGNLQGTWSEEIVHPDTDIFEVLGAPTLIRDKYIKKIL